MIQSPAHSRASGVNVGCGTLSLGIRKWYYFQGTMIFNFVRDSIETSEVQTPEQSRFWSINIYLPASEL